LVPHHNFIIYRQLSSVEGTLVVGGSNESLTGEKSTGIQSAFLRWLLLSRKASPLLS
jgi:hypothetical protein